ncbi:MAG: D-2-hydroxyacid dehydrogenase [Synergistaceae bacterium]|nr:D-2-hydroxyacid dehydrogenase [Synergistaceae bacterium]
MKIVVLDGYTLNPGDLTWDELKTLGDVTIYDRTDPEDTKLILERIGDAEVVLTNKTPLSADTIEKAPNIGLIAVMATGYNVVDTAKAKEKGIPVCNVPVYGTAAVAQTAIAMLLEICHHVGEHNRSVQNGDWIKCPDYSYWNYPLIELAGKTMGIIGLGRIGQRTAAIAQALGMKVLAFDTYKNKNLECETLQYADLDSVLSSSDVIVMHCPQNAENAKMINRETIAKMKDGVIFINNSRGGLVNEEDLVEALKSGKIQAAALDVISAEPMAKDSPLLGLPNCIITPHMSWAPLASRARLLGTVIDDIKAYQAGKPINVVNP